MKLKSLMMCGLLSAIVAGGVTTASQAADAPKPAGSVHKVAKKHFTKVGLLACRGERSVGYIIGSSMNLSCTFENARGGDIYEYYDGSITKLGPDIGFKNSETLLWAVYAPSYQVPDGRLDGNYVGVSASAGIVVGVGANVLVGNLKDNINLVPLSVSGNRGLNASAGIGALNLRSVSR